ncbi:rhamnosyltransferase [Paraburkholderia sp. 1N]|uniref:Rhamnosyltransferase n=2 Tax=Paraburkholderia solitsugae TaxID=2675748 RepID=A0ABX2BNL5_9BURK|nr:rhamnosyltransferase [Paraburkholderia solitsugae]
MTFESVRPNNAGVVAIVVSYEPNLAHLAGVLAAIASQTDSVVVVDNGSRRDVRGLLTALNDSRLHFLPLHRNLGIAAAHNAGICWARNYGGELVLLMDQDSVPDPQMVVSLRSAHESLERSGNKVAAVGPRFRDSDSGRLSDHVKFGRLRIERVTCPQGQKYVQVDFLISSGSLIRIDTLDAIGGMDEALFIDQVDTEWVLRARAKGYLTWGHCEAIMTHSLGEIRRRVWLGRWREVPIHKPFRYYYIFRNSVLLQRRDYPCWAWKRVDLIRLLQLAVFIVLFHPQRLQALRGMLGGLWSGLTMKR